MSVFLSFSGLHLSEGFAGIYVRFFRVSGSLLKKYEGAFLVGSNLAPVIRSVCSPPWLQQLCLHADFFSDLATLEIDEGGSTKMKTNLAGEVSTLTRHVSLISDKISGSFYTQVQ